MNQFNEFALIAALCCREEDARSIQKVFNPDWLEKAELQPILRAIFDYMDTQSMTPSIDSLAQFMKDKDQAKYEARWKATLEQLRSFKDMKLMAFNVARAKEAAAARAFQYLIKEDRIQKMIEAGDAKALKGEMSKWVTKHTESEDEGLYPIQAAFDKVVDDHPWQGRQPKIATGIHPIDEWSGGLRPAQMGIIMAPSGHGKSTLLMNIARYAAAIEQKRVLFITNEMTINEQTERFLARMQDPKPDASGNLSFVTLDQIQEDPSTAYKKLEGYQKELNSRLYLYSAGLDQNSQEVEDVMRQIAAEYGGWPDMVVIDYIERMATVSRMDKAASWTYYGQIAKELLWLAKRRKCAVWTAIQTNRSGMNKKVELGMEHGQGSIQHFQEAALALAVRRVMVNTGGDDLVTGLEFFEMKARHSAMEGRRMVVRADLGRMYISDEEIEDIESIEEVDPADIQSGPAPKIKSQASVKGKV
jgi:replicative DNA helicase